MSGREPPVISIVLPHREAFGPEGAGAVAMVVRRLAAGSRHPARVLGPPLAGAPFPDAPFVAVRSPALPLGVTRRHAVGAARALARLPPGPVEVHNKPDVAALLARLLPRRPVSLFLHNDPREMRGARSPAARRRLLARLAGVAVVSSYLRDALLDGVDLAGVRPPWVLHNAFDPSELPAPAPPERREPLILFAGRVVPDKAPDAFVAACALALPRLPGWRAEVVGADGFSAAGPETRFIARLRPEAARAGVALLGFRPHAEVLEMMARAAVVVVPSRWAEPFGLTALEAMACGAALACSRRGGLAEVAGEACVPVDPDDPAGMADALVALAQGGARRAALSAAGLERARTRFAAADAVARLDAERDRVIAAWTTRRGHG